MATSSVQICNDALIILGAATITSLSDDTKEARLCNEQYDKCRQQLLVAHPWNFAISRSEISSDASLPTGYDNNPEWDYSFTLASNCLRVLELDDTDAPWAVEGGKLFSTYDPVNIKYIKNVTDTTIFSKNFEKALAYMIAYRIGYALTQSATLISVLKEEFEASVREARSFDAQEGSVKVVEATDWLNRRD